jgi:hypothetical protein
VDDAAQRVMPAISQEIVGTGSDSAGSDCMGEFAALFASLENTRNI